MAAVMSGAMEFGFVPSETVSALHDLGNWKVRADAIERLSACVSDLAPGGRAALPRINEFVAFLNKLLGDPNFKISLTTLQIWETLLQKLGKQARPAVEVVVPTLVKKLGDSKSVVKEANMRALNSLYRVLPEDTVHAIFSVYDGGGKFSRERSIRARDPRWPDSRRTRSAPSCEPCSTPIGSPTRTSRTPRSCPGSSPPRPRTSRARVSTTRRPI